MSIIGESVRRADGEAKVRGETVYGIDYEEPRLLHGRILRSAVPAGRIVHLDTSDAERLPGVRAIVTAADAPSRSGLIVKDQTLMAGDVVRHVGEPIAAVAADTVSQAFAAIGAIDLEIAQAEAVLEIDRALESGAPLVHPEWESYATVMPGPRTGNVAWESALRQGDVEAAFARDDVVVVEDEFRAPRQHQAYIEPRCAVARYEQGRYVVHTSTQFPFLCRDRVAEFLGVRSSDVRVVGTAVGGGFGGKLDASLEPFSALLARKAGRPVRLFNWREEEFLSATPRDNGIVRIRSAVTSEGSIVAQEATALIDSGAYAGDTAAIASVPMLILPSAYRVGAARYVGKAVYTNTPPTGAYRGVCGTYLVFAVEQHMDHIAEVLGIDRRELRMLNVYRDGDSYPSGQALPKVAFQEAFDRIEAAAPWSELSRKRPNRGVGIAAVSWLTNPMPGSATLKLNEDGTVGLITAAAEIGTGAVATGLIQVVAEELGIRPEDVVVLAPDTDAAPYDAGAQGSRTLFNVGNAIRKAADEVRAQVLDTAAGLLEADAADLVVREGHVEVMGAQERRVSLAAVAEAALWSGGPIAGKGKYVSPPIPFDASCVTGAFFTTLNAATFHVHLAEVEVDPGTGKVTILRYVVAQDVGKAVNPQQIEGQIQGGVAQGIGYALYENVRFEDGVPLELDLESYRLPTALDVPPIEIILLEYPSEHGPYGAKGAAEPSIVPVAAVLASAIADAVGKRFHALPISPFDILAALGGEASD
jgi:CO/xanthine dehydrogenase Mo-binding subunit